MIKVRMITGKVDWKKMNIAFTIEYEEDVGFIVGHEYSLGGEGYESGDILGSYETLPQAIRQLVDFVQTIPYQIYDAEIHNPCMICGQPVTEKDDHDVAEVINEVLESGDYAEDFMNRLAMELDQEEGFWRDSFHICWEHFDEAYSRLTYRD